MEYNLTNKRSLIKVITTYYGNGFIVFILSILIAISTVGSIYNIIAANTKLALMFLLVFTIPFARLIVVFLTWNITTSIMGMYRKYNIIRKLPITEEERKRLGLNSFDYMLFLTCHRLYSGTYGRFYLADIPDTLIENLTIDEYSISSLKLRENVNKSRDIKIILNRAASFVNPECMDMCQKMLDDKGFKYTLISS